MQKFEQDKITIADMKAFLDEQVERFNQLDFIPHDPVAIPHLFHKAEDIEISGFLTATISWGQRSTILKNARWMMEQMDFAPYQFIRDSSANEIKKFRHFVHRTFNGTDCQYFIIALKQIYRDHSSMAHLFENLVLKHSMKHAIHHFRKLFFALNHEKRTEKHLSDPLSDSACKRFNMFLRWMIRQDASQVDFGLWKIPASQLYCPLDVHSGRVARELGLLQRKQNDWKAVVELTDNLLKLDARDPVKYDFALFGLGVNERVTPQLNRFV